MDEERIGVAEFWIRTMIAVGCIYGIYYITSILCDTITTEIVTYVAGIVVNIYIFLQGIKRMNDIGEYWTKLFIPIYNIILLLRPGKDERDAYRRY